MSDFRFRCPSCGRKYKSNKDLTGRLKRCGQCRKTFVIAEAAATSKGAPPPPPRPPHETVRITHDPELPADEAFTALAEWQRRARALPGSFARDVTFGHFEPVFRLTLESAVEEHGRRARTVTHRETAVLPPGLAEEARRGTRPFIDLTFERSAEVLDKLAAKAPAVRPAAELVLKETPRPESGRFVSRRLTVEHLHTWKAHWVFGDREGAVWFYGRPLRVFLPDPPRRRTWPAAVGVLFGLVAVGVAGRAALDFGLFRDAPAPVAPPPPPPPAKAKAEPLRFAKDGVLVLDDGAILRGSLERKEDAVLVRAKGQSQSVPPWRIDTLHVEAPVFLRGELRRLEVLESRVREAREAKPPAPRERYAELFLEQLRQRERWERLEPLFAASELPAGQAPRPRLDALRVEIERALDTSELLAKVPANVLEPAPAAPAPPPAAAAALDLFKKWAGALDGDARRALAGSFQELRAEKIPEADLVHFAYVYLSRSDLEAGLVSDRVNVKTSQVDLGFDGVLEKQGDYFVRLRTPSGPEVAAYKEPKGWVAHLPGGTRLEEAQVTATPGAKTASAGHLRAALDRFPPARWAGAPAAEHLRAARAAAEPLEKKGAPVDRGVGLLRFLAAAHAATALRTGTPAEIVEARGLLQKLGYAASPEGRWERAEDRRAAQVGRHLRESRPEEAQALLRGPRGAQDFFAAYRALAVELHAPMRDRADFDRVDGAVDAALAQSATPGESKHLQALKSAVAGFGLCGQCGGTAARTCSTCRGKGQRTEACAPCRGLGYIVTVGIGASGHKTCDTCKGQPIRGTRPCERCEGKGTRGCPKCTGVAARLPAPTDLARASNCRRCAGTGAHGDLVLFACPSCAGLGLQLVPAGAPDATLP
jgi:hypothetical protein